MTTRTSVTFVWPIVTARNARSITDFYGAAFGFTISALFGEGDHVEHAELLWPLGGGIMLGDECLGSDQPSAVGTFSAYVVTDEPGVLHERAMTAGAAEVRALNGTDYGSREFPVRDPEEN